MEVVIIGASFFFFEAPKNKRITLSTTVAELYARENQCLVDDRSICIHNF